MWIGFDDGHSLHLSGGDACVPIWTAHMNRIIGLVPDVDWKRPEDVVEREIDPQSGMLATPYCSQTKSEIFVEGTEPTAVCPLHAGSGEPSPLWSGEPVPSLGGEHAEAITPPEAPGTNPPATPAQKQKRERGIKRLLKIIFGGGGG